MKCKMLYVLLMLMLMANGSFAQAWKMKHRLNHLFKKSTRYCTYKPGTPTTNEIPCIYRNDRHEWNFDLLKNNILDSLAIVKQDTIMLYNTGASGYYPSFTWKFYQKNAFCLLKNEELKYNDGTSWVLNRVMGVYYIKLKIIRHILHLTVYKHRKQIRDYIVLGIDQNYWGHLENGDALYNPAVRLASSMSK